MKLKKRADGAKNEGELHAMMLDMKRTFDEIVEAHASPAKAAQILANPFYQSLSSSFAGTQEYMAMEKLGQLRASGQWDLIVVDTPPARSALDFLDAPARLGALSRRPVHPDAARAGEGRWPRLHEGDAGRARPGHRNDDEAARHTTADRRPDLRRCDGHDVRRPSRNEPTPPRSCCARPARCSSLWRRRSPMRCAKRRISSTGWSKKTCRSRAWW